MQTVWMMKRLLERTIEHRPDTWCSRITYPEFVLPRHKHVEYEIMVVTRGSGIRYVGEQAARFEASDVALIGSNVPHLHLCDSRLHPAKGMVPAAGEVLQFRPELFPEGMERVPDYRPLVRLLRDSQSGLRFTGRRGWMLNCCVGSIAWSRCTGWPVWRRCSICLIV